MIRFFVRKTNFWKSVSWYCALSGVDADAVLDMTLLQFIAAVRNARRAT